MFLATMEKMREGDRDVNQALFAPWECGIANPDFKPPTAWDKYFAVHVIGAGWRFTWGGQAENHYLNYSQKFVSASRKAAINKSAVEFAPAVADFENCFASAGVYSQARFFLTKLLLPTWPSIERKALCAESEKALVLAAIALKRYDFRYGKPAPQLSALVPDFLASVPIDYLSGKPLNYRLNPDGTWVLYSVGEDGNDDGGVLRPDGTFWSHRGIWNGEDAVWPMPASKQEVDEFERKQKERLAESR